MATATLVSTEEYLSTSYRPDCEYLDGIILERNVGEHDHGRTQTRLAIFFGLREREWGIRVIVELRVQVKAQRFRVPDVYVCAATAPIEPIITQPPILCVEILSKDDRMSEMMERVNDYLAFGAPSVWVIDPGARRGYVYSPGTSHEPVDGVLRVAQTPIAVPLADILPEMDAE